MANKFTVGDVVTIHGTRTAADGHTATVERVTRCEGVDVLVQFEGGRRCVFGAEFMTLRADR